MEKIFSRFSVKLLLSLLVFSLLMSGTLSSYVDATNVNNPQAEEEKLAAEEEKDKSEEDKLDDEIIDDEIIDDEIIDDEIIDDEDSEDENNIEEEQGSDEGEATDDKKPVDKENSDDEDTSNEGEVVEGEKPGIKDDSKPDVELENPQEEAEKPVNKPPKGPTAYALGLDVKYGGKVLEENMVATIQDMNPGNNRAVSVTANFSDNTSQKKITLRTTSVYSYKSLPGMKNTSGGMVFDANILPDQLKGVVTGGKFIAGGKLIPTALENQSGVVEYTIHPEASSVTIEFLLSMELTHFINSNGVTFNEPLIMSAEEGPNVQTKKQKTLSYDVKMVVRPAGHAAYSPVLTVTPEKLTDIYTTPFVVTAWGTGLATSTFAGQQYFKEMSFDIRYSKEITINGVSFNTLSNANPGISNNIEIVHDVKPTDSKYKYSKVIIKGGIAGDSNKGYRFNYDVEEGLSDPFDLVIEHDPSLTIYTENNFGDGGSENNSALPKYEITHRVFNNDITIKDRIDQISIYDRKNTIIPLGLVHVVNEYEDDLTDIMFKANFTNGSVGVTEINLNTSQYSGDLKSKVYNIHGETTKGRFFTVDDIVADRGAGRTINIYDILSDVASDEFLAELNWTESDIPAKYSNAVTNSISGQYSSRTSIVYYGILKDSVVPGRESVIEVSAVNKQNGDFTSDVATKGTSSMTFVDGNATLPIQPTQGSFSMLAGDRFEYFGAWSYVSRTVSTMLRASEGFALYFRELPGISFNTNSLKLVDHRGIVYSRENGNLELTILVDKDGNRLIKAEVRDIDMNLYNGLSRLNWSMDARTLNTATTFSYTNSEIAFYETFNENVVGDPIRSSDLAAATGIDTYQSTVQMSTTSTVNNMAQKSFITSTSVSYNNGLWSEYDGTEHTITNVNPVKDLNYRFTFANTSGISIPGFSAIIPIPKKGETTGNTIFQDNEFGFDMNVLEQVKITSPYTFRILYSTEYTSELAHTNPVWKSWSEVSGNKEAIKSILITTDDLITSTENGTSDNPGEGLVTFPLGFNESTADAQSGGINAYSALVYRKLGNDAASVSSDPTGTKLYTGIANGTLFTDRNRNGVQNSGDLGIPRARVTAYEAGFANDPSKQVVLR